MKIKPMSEKGDENALKNAIHHYIETGNYDVYAAAWPGRNFLEKVINQHADLRNALVSEVKQRARGAQPPTLPEGIDLVAFTRSRVKPMVEGLFPGSEQGAVLGLLERSVVFLTPENIERVLSEEDWHSTAWDLANLYLGSLGLVCLDGRRSYLVGLSQETTCFVSLTYFTEKDRFADFIVHEAAHVFHNWKRTYAGLPHTRRREWMLDIEFRKRETFAYACETLSRLLALGRTRSERRALLDEYARTSAPGDERVDRTELIAILGEAIGARNCWKRILAGCAPPRRRGPQRAQ